MHSFKVLALGLSAALVVACGGGGNGDQSPKIKYTTMVVFGDSLSDIGSYRVGPIATAGGGRFSVNPANPATPTNWTELVSAQLGLNAPCAARLGGFGVAPIAPNASTCRNYAQGGSRVSITEGNGYDGVYGGALTHPVSKQIENYGIDNGSANFSGKELVTVFAGGNDILILLDQLKSDSTATGQAAFVTSLAGQLAVGATNPSTAGPVIARAMANEAAREGNTSASIVAAAVSAAYAAGNIAAASPSVYGPMVTTATGLATDAGNQYAATNGPALVGQMGGVGTTLAGDITTNIVGKGAKYVAVLNLPDVSTTPSGLANGPATRALILAMVNQFNTTLKAGLAGTPGVLFIDTFTNGQDQILHKENYLLSNVVDKACDSTKADSSLICTAATLITGDTSHYLFADGVHLTPYGYKLLAQLVTKEMVLAGWL